MRAAPCGLLPNISADDAFRVGCHQAAITHGHVEGWASAGALSRIVWGMARGEPLWQAASEAADCANMVQGYLTENLIRHVIAIAHGPLLTPQEIVGELGEGWVGEEALAVGLYAALVGKNYRHALRIAITHDGDSDSTGSIAGNILGARDGAAIVPTAWIGMLDLAHVCRQTAFRFCEEYNIV
jgi:ADP-ribosylglycohydrolase